MHTSIWVTSVLATLALAVPSTSVPAPGDLSALTDYFQVVARKVKEGNDIRKFSSCDLSQAQMPASPVLPPPGPGQVLKHVAIGRGTQNYTCVAGDANAVPVAAGAVAALFNASCLAATYPGILAKVPAMALQVTLKSLNQARLDPGNLYYSGAHFFTDGKTPFFNLDTPGMELGQAFCSKDAGVPAPSTSVAGQGKKGFGAVPWLKLVTKAPSTGGLAAVYRLNTAGGNPPPTCADKPASFTIEYAAEYWFFEQK